jgi:oxygen-independent coproporphyrinogen-3 oxidase
MPVLGFGCGAFSNYKHTRWGNVRELSDYLRKTKDGESVVGEKAVVSSQEMIGEFFFLGMRTLPGISIKEFQLNTGLDLLPLFEGPLQFLVENGLIRVSGGMIGLTPRGCILSNEVFAEFLRFLDSLV